MATTAELRKKNRNLIYRYIYAATDEPVTKQDLAHDLNLSMPTVSQNLKELMDLGLIQYTGTMDSTGGRRPKAIRADGDARFALGLMVTSSSLRMVCTNLRGEILAKKRVMRPFQLEAGYFDALAEEIETLLDEHGLDRVRLLGVGISLPLSASEDVDMITLAPAEVQKKLEVNRLRRHIPYPCHLEHNANAGSRAEWWNNAELDSIVYLSVQAGISGAMVLGGHRYHGQNQRCGEFGHMSVVPGGRACRCGKRGCLEAYCSLTRLAEAAACDVDTFFERLKAGDHGCVALWRDYLDHLALGIHNIRMILDCDIILGGVLAQYMDPYLEDLRGRLHDLDVFHSDGSYLQLSRYRAWSASVGSALYYVSEFIDRI